MNVFTSRITNDEERLRIASRSPVKVFVPTVENTQYVSDFTGDYWPYRALEFDDVIQDRNAVERTVNRSAKFALTDSRPPGSNFPLELYDIGEDLGVDYVFPIVHTGVSRDAIGYPVTAYQECDFENGPALGTPVPHPYELTINCIKEGLYNESRKNMGVSPTSHPNYYVIRGMKNNSISWSSLRDVIELLHNSTSGDATIHLHEPPITDDLVRYVRANTGKIDALTLPRDLEGIQPTQIEEASDTLAEAFSKRGKEYLRDGLCPHVRLAAEFSLLCSTFIEIDSEKELAALIDESIIPHGGKSMQPVTQSDDEQSDLTSLIT